MPTNMTKGAFVLLLTIVLTFVTPSVAQDGQTDNSSIHPDSKSLEYLLPLFTIHGIPKNEDTDNPVTILVNHGYAIGFSSKYNQPLWAAYQVSKAKRDVDYERFPFFVDDLRLPAANRIGADTFGNGYDRGHLAPNEVINRQYSKLSQMETFLMSNISPQKADLNQGVWVKLETNIREKYPTAVNGDNKMYHLWVIVGPVFAANPEFITRPNGSRIAVPDSFYCILIRPNRYPHDSPGNADYLTFIFKQDIKRNENVALKFVTSINEIESLTKLNFLPTLSSLMENRIENFIATQLW